MTELHEKYAPILRFARGESFLPARVEEVLRYCSLYAKDQGAPLLRQGQVTPEQIVARSRSTEVFLRSVDSGPLTGLEVIAGWSRQTVDLVHQWASKAASEWTENLARKAYSWFSPKTKSATQLFWWNDLILPLFETIEQSDRGDFPRLVLPAETRDDAIERYRHKRVPPYTYYYRQVQDGQYLCLQYWFFYSYNDWGRTFDGVNDHEGDWEGLYLFFRLDGWGHPQEPPAYITFPTHESRLTKPWGHKDVTLVGTHPVGYVGAGSHATYPEAKAYSILASYNLRDYATGDGPAIDHDQWTHRIDLDKVSWLTDYRGSWGTRYWLPLEKAKSILGILTTAAPLLRIFTSAAPDEIELPGVSAPRGPRGSGGKERPQWAHPVEWANVPPT
ncbi:MAG: hypothetical protein ACE5H9_01230 [Anaerolineae bacterium]